MRIDVTREGDVEERLDRAIQDLQRRAFPHEARFETSRHYVHPAGPDDLRVLGWSGGELVAQVVGFWIHARAGERTLRLLGLGNVCSDPDRKGQGFAGQLIERTLEEARRGGADFALLFCRPALESYYARFGFVKVANPILLTRPDGTTYTREARDSRMAAPLTDAAWPEGPLVLDVDDF